MLPEGTILNWDGVNIPIAPAARGPRPQPQLARRLGAGGRAAGRRARSRPPSPRCARSSRRSSRARTSRRTSATTRSRASTCARGRATPTTTSRCRTCARSQLMGEEATRLTGYPSISIFHDFKYHPKTVIKGGDVDWIYDHLGAYAWVTEFWSPQRRAGISEYHFIDWLREHSPEDELAVLKVADELGEGYVDWYPFEHPQLGPVEIGGWDLVRFWFNPPLSRLEEEVKPHADFALFLALVSPRLEIRSFESEPVADGAFRLRLVLENAGWLPTNVTEKALERKRGAPDRGRARAPGRRADRERQGARGGGPARRPRRAAPGHLVEHRPLDGRAHEGRVGDRGERRRARRASSRGTSARAPFAPSSSSSRARAGARRAAHAAPRDRASGPGPAPGQVLLRVRACGVCRTDLHIVDGDLTHPKLPLVLGHQIVGEVVQGGGPLRRGRPASASPGSGGRTASAASASQVPRTSAIGPASRIRRRRRLRRAGGRGRAVLLPDPRRLRGRAGGAAPLRRSHRLPIAPARRGRRADRAVRLRSLGAHRLPGRGRRKDGRSSRELGPATTRPRRSRARSARSGRATPSPARPRSSTPSSSSHPSASSSPRPFDTSARAARSSARGST